MSPTRPKKPALLLVHDERGFFARCATCNWADTKRRQVPDTAYSQGKGHKCQVKRKKKKK